MVNIIEEVAHSGDSTSSSLDGKIAINDNAGEILIRDQSNIRRSYQGSRKSPTGFGMYITRPGIDVITELES